MTTTYITTLPDEAGAFLEAGKIIGAHGGNITRVSYNKAVDVHTLFMDVEADIDAQTLIEEDLRRIGYIRDTIRVPHVLLVEFSLRNESGSVLPVLELISRYHFNISYMSSRANNTPDQMFRMGLLVEDPVQVNEFLTECTNLCPIRIIDYNESERTLDNTVFYIDFADSLAWTFGLSRDNTVELMRQANLLMQGLDERGEEPRRIFKYIGRWADMLAGNMGDNFQPRISQYELHNGMILHNIEPPCGSNTYILEKGGDLLFVDCGFGLYEREMLQVLRGMFADFDKRHKALFITHPDIDHVGLWHLFDDIYVGAEAYQYFELENQGLPNFREQNPVHAPYCRISRILTDYTTIPPDKLHVVGDAQDTDLFAKLGEVTFAGETFTFYRGNGGHAKGEVVIVSGDMIFSGDIVVNIKGFTDRQLEFNKVAPYLMTSVNMDSKLATLERKELLKRYPLDEYLYCPGHGAVLRPGIDKL